MRFDTLSTFCDKQTLSGSTTDSTNVLDLGKSEIAEAQQCYVVVTVDTKVTAATNVALRTSSDNTTYYTVASVDFPANSDVGTQKTIVIPPGCGRYLKLTATGTSMGGAISAGITLRVQSQKGIEQFEMNC